MKNAIFFIIRLYQKTFSPDQGLLVKVGLKKPSSCMFSPTCSEYALQAIEKHGIVKGIHLFIFRLMKCHPWSKPDFDPIP